MEDFASARDVQNFNMNFHRKKDFIKKLSRNVLLQYSIFLILAILGLQEWKKSYNKKILN